METINEFFGGYRAVWFVLGLILSGAISYIVSRKLVPIYADTVHDLQGMHASMVESYKIQIAELKAERNDYRDKLHEEKELHHATTLKIADLEARPNVEQIYQSQQDFFTKMSGHMDEQTKTMQAIHTSLMDHDKGIEKRTAEVVDRILLGVRNRDSQ